MTNHPPKWLLRFFRWFCHPDYVEDIEGDLCERFALGMEKTGLRKARLKFLVEVLLLFRPGIIRPLPEKYTIINYAMLRHNLLISYRNFLRNKSSFLINLVGLSTGLACALLIFLWVQDEYSIDKFHENDDQLYQVLQEWRSPDDIQLVEWTPGPLADALIEEVPEVLNATTYKTHEYVFDGVISTKENMIRATPLFADRNFLHVFSYSLLFGEKNQVLDDKYAVIISESLAYRLFDDPKEAVGKPVRWDKKVGNFVDFGGDFIITGVFKNIPNHSTSQFDLIFTFDFFTETSPNVMMWENDQSTNAIVLNKDVNIEEVENKISELVASKRGLERETGFYLQKYSSQYLYGNYENGQQAGGRITYVWLFSAIAILILLIACINFMNLSTAKASARIKEIGVKKTLGAQRGHLIFQFVNESILLSMIALFIAIGWVMVLMPQFNEITGKQLSLGFDVQLALMCLGIAFITGLISSIYPALYLSSFQPIIILKGKLEAAWGDIWIRKGLVIFQFTASVILIVTVWVIYSQVNFIQSKNLGYDRENILHVKKEGALNDKLESFLAEVKALPQVISASNSNDELIGSENFSGGIDWEGRVEDESILINVFSTNYDFLETYNIPLKAGRDFSKEYGTDTLKVILNEAAVKAMNIENPIGQTVTFWGDEVEIIGVTENFHFQSLYEQVAPCIFHLFREGNNYGDQIWIKMKTGQEQEAIEQIAEIYHSFNPDFPFEYGFVDEQYHALYVAENRISILSKYFAGLAIIISCLGLFGLATFTTERRTKEIGIRKVLGASASDIIALLSKDFNKMVVVGIAFALPISYIISQNWLQNFAFKIDLQWWYFAGTAFITLMIAWLTIGFQTFKAANVNPAECLRDE